MHLFKGVYIVVSHSYLLQPFAAEVAPKLAGLGFEVFLLPSVEHRQAWHSLARFPDNGLLQPGAAGSPDDDVIDGLLTEVRQVIGSAKFGAALKVSIAYTEIPNAPWKSYLCKVQKIR